MGQAEEQSEMILSVNGLEVTYDHVIIAIQGVSIEVPKNKTVGLLGINGAGKTTTLRAITGFLGVDNAKITDGNIEFCGERIDGAKPYEISKKGIRLVLERTKVFDTLTTKENLEFCAGKSDFKEDILDTVYRYFPSLRSRQNELAGYLSGGERQVLAISQALLSGPKLLMIDEMSLGLSPKVVTEVVEVLTSLKDKLDLAILVVEQNVAIALGFIDYGYILENGRVVFSGTPEELSSHEDVREFYLGLGKEGARSYRDVKQYRRTRRWWA